MLKSEPPSFPCLSRSIAQYSGLGLGGGRHDLCKRSVDVAQTQSPGFAEIADGTVGLQSLLKVPVLPVFIVHCSRFPVAKPNCFNILVYFNFFS